MPRQIFPILSAAVFVLAAVVTGIGWATEDGKVTVAGLGLLLLWAYLFPKCMVAYGNRKPESE